MVAFTSNFRLTKPDFNSIGWDVQLNSDLDIIDSVLGQFNTGLTIQGVWLNATLYPAGVSVIDGLTGHVWLTSTTHTSSSSPATFANDRASFPTYWTDITNPAISASVSAAASAASAASAAASLASITSLLAGGTTGTGRVVLDTSPTIVSATFTTTVVLTGVVSGAGIVAYFASPPPIGNTARSTGAFTTLAANDVVTLAPATTPGTINNTSIGQTTPLAGSFTTLTGALRGFISGLQMSAPGGAVTITITAGASSDSTNTIYMSTASTFTKTTASWTLGTAGGMLDTGATGGTASAWHHIYQIIRPDTGVVDFTMSLNAATPALSANYTKFRRIGSVFLDASKNIRGFTQFGDEFRWITQLSDIDTSVSGALGTTATLYPLSTPLGIKTIAMIRGTISHAAAGNSMLINSPDETSIAGGAMTTNNRTANTQIGGIRITFFTHVRTDILSQVRAVADVATTTVNAGAHAYIDIRGKDS